MTAISGSVPDVPMKNAPEDPSEAWWNSLDKLPPPNNPSAGHQDPSLDALKDEAGQDPAAARPTNDIHNALTEGSPPTGKSKNMLKREASRARKEEERKRRKSEEAAAASKSITSEALALDAKVEAGLLEEKQME
jgi:hypothetical protein